MSGAFFWRALTLSLAASAAILIAGCSNDGDDGGGLSVVTTLALFSDMASNVAGDRANVDSIVPSGADPHTFEPSPGDVRKISQADVVFANGLDLEPATKRVIDANLSSGAVLVELAEAAIGSGLPALAADDPHLWMDPANGREYAAIIRDALITADPGGRGTYSDNYEAYAALLDDTATYMRDTTAPVPAENRLIIATHDAFGYMARAVGFEIAGFVVPGPGQDASPADISKLVSKIEDLGIPAVFTEPQTSVETRTLEQIAADAGAQVCELYSGALDDRVPTYVGLLRFDAEELARCLGGDGA